MKKIIPTAIIATTTIASLAIGLNMEKNTKPQIVHKPIVVTPVQVSAFFSDCGKSASNHGHVRDLLLTEKPATVDITSIDRKAYVQEHLDCLTPAEMDKAVKQGQKDFNQLLVKKAKSF